MKQPTRIPVHVRFTGRFIRSYEVVEREPPAEWYAAGTEWVVRIPAVLLLASQTI